MKRRHFAELAGLAALSPRKAFALGVQDPMHLVSYPEFAIRLAEMYHSVSARTELQPSAREASDLLYDSAVAVITGDAERAGVSLDQFADAAQAQLPRLSEVAEGRGIIEFANVIRRGIDQCQMDVSQFDETRDVIVDRLPLQLIVCLIRTPTAFEPCLGPLWKKTLACALVSIPMARLGVYGYAGAVGTCLFDDLVDVAIDVVTDCFPRFRDQVASCFG